MSAGLRSFRSVGFAAMAGWGEIGSRMLVLGLLIERPDTPSGVAGRLKSRFGVAQFSSNLAHTVTRRLTDDGLLQVMEGDENRRAARSCPTGDGVACFAEWLHERSSGPPPVRDATRMRLWLCRDLADVRRRVLEIDVEIKDCEREQESAHAELLAAQRLQELRSANKRDWRAARDAVMLADQMAYWVDRGKELYTLRENLHELLEEFDDESPGR
jgi:hypothetical protein